MEANRAVGIERLTSEEVRRGARMVTQQGHMSLRERRRQMEMSAVVTTDFHGATSRGGGGTKLPRLPPISPDTPKLRHAQLIMHNGDMIARNSGAANVSPKIKKRPSPLSMGSGFDWRDK